MPRRQAPSRSPDDPLPASFYDRDPELVALDLLGKRLIRDSDEGRVEGRIVEVEAYLASGDPACHAARGETRRNASMFGPPGRAYVYSIHARYCFNAVVQPEQSGSAILIRALEPLQGLDIMRARRGRDRLLDLTRGPARLCEAFAIDTGWDSWDLCQGNQLWIAHELPAADQIVVGRSPRIGIRTAQDLLLRFFADGNRFVSGPRHTHTRPVQ